MSEIKFCQRFYCDARGDRYCCATCYFLERCHNPCMNHPSRCRLEDTAKAVKLNKEDMDKWESLKS